MLLVVSKEEKLFYYALYAMQWVFKFLSSFSKEIEEKKSGESIHVIYWCEEKKLCVVINMSHFPPNPTSC